MQCKCSGSLVVLQTICSTKEVFLKLLLLKFVFDFNGKATGLCEEQHNNNCNYNNYYYNDNNSNNRKPYNYNSLQQQRH